MFDGMFFNFYSFLLLVCPEPGHTNAITVLDKQKLNWCEVWIWIVHSELPYKHGGATWRTGVSDDYKLMKTQL